MPSITNPDPWLPPVPIPPGLTPPTIQVYRVNGGTTLTALPSVRCMHIEQHSGPDTGRASFRYDFGNGDSNAPQSVVQALDIAYNFGETIQAGDTLAVKVTRWDGRVSWPFYGIALEFSGRMDSDSDQAIIEAVGIAKRLWDTPIPGAIMRDCSDPTKGKDVQTDIVAQFNPKGLPNATPAGAEVVPANGNQLGKYATFIEPAIARKAGSGRKWTLPMACAYLLWGQNADQRYVQNPTVDQMNLLLVGKQPKSGVPFDPDSPSTYTSGDIIVSDRPITGRDVPTVLHEMLRGYGFDLAFSNSDSGGVPLCSLRMFLRQSGPIKKLYLQAPNSGYADWALSNVAELQVGRTLDEVVNQWEVHGAVQRYECSFILAPGFARTWDRTPSTLADYKKGSAWYKEHPDDYRLFIFSEDGSPYAHNFFDLDQTKANLLVDKGGLSITGNAPYDLAVRRRKPFAELISEVNGGKRRATLSYSEQWSGSGADGLARYPCLWDGTATDWKPIAGGWSLLTDRIGIRFNVNDPNAIHVGDDPATGQPIKLNLVERLTLTDAAQVFFRLTCVIEGDAVCKGVAKRTSSGSRGYDPSPIPYPVTRIVDARDRFFSDAVHPSSEFNTGNNVGGRDDTSAAIAEASQLRSATEAGILAGQAAIPYFTDYYRIGDRIEGISGLALGFRTDGGGSANTPVYPMVEGIRYELDGAQMTTLYLSDESTVRRTRPERRRR